MNKLLNTYIHIATAVFVNIVKSLRVENKTTTTRNSTQKKLKYENILNMTLMLFKVLNKRIFIRLCECHSN